MPRPKKPGGETRNVTIRVRFTAGEKTHLKNAAKERALTMSDFIRATAISTASIFRKASPERAAFIKGLAVLGKLGSNINQIAKHLNTVNKTGEPPKLAPEVLARAMARVDKLADHLTGLFTDGD